MQIDLRKVKELSRDSNDVINYIDGFFEDCIKAGDTPLLSDILSKYNDGGAIVLESLAYKCEQDRDLPENMRFMWKLQVRRDQWGNPPQPGDIVQRRVQKPLFHDRNQGKPVSSSELTIDKINGDYDKKWNRYFPYEVDEKGCISVNFESAVSLIKQFGIHPNSKRGGHPLSLHLREHSQEPVEAPNGEKIHVWYWRFMEVDKEAYEKLPKIKKTTERKRGIDPIEEKPK